jgi:hypothetical protein
LPVFGGFSEPPFPQSSRLLYVSLAGLASIGFGAIFPQALQLRFTEFLKDLEAK